VRPQRGNDDGIKKTNPNEFLNNQKWLIESHLFAGIDAIMSSCRIWDSPEPFLHWLNFVASATILICEHVVPMKIQLIEILWCC